VRIRSAHPHHGKRQRRVQVPRPAPGGDGRQPARVARHVAHIPFLREGGGRCGVLGPADRVHGGQQGPGPQDSAKIRYQDRLLSGDEVTYFSSIQMLDARGDPKLVDAGQEFFGERMDYDLDAEAGVVNQGSTKFEQGYYRGKTSPRWARNEMKVWGSRYTTCELKVPHDYIKAPHMKVYPKDKAVSGSTVLYVGETRSSTCRSSPTASAPVGDRDSSAPTSSSASQVDRDATFRNVGYFWATNDYTDFTFLGDFNEDQSFRTTSGTATSCVTSSRFRGGGLLP